VRLLRGDGPLIRVGHRGAALLAPENTLESFEAALAQGVDAIEFDVVAPPDGGPLLMGHSLAELPERPATLEEGLEFLGARDVALHVDLKLTTRLDEVAAALERHGLVERSVVSSFHLPSLRAVAAHPAPVPIGFTYPEDRYGVSRRPVLRPVLRAGLVSLRAAAPRFLPRLIRRAGASALMLQHALVTARSVAAAHGLGAPVLAWTVDEPADLERVLEAGVDGVITNDPRIFAAIGT